MNTLLLTFIAFILALAILVTVHEFGHFWVAKKLGVKVLRFSVGFGKPLWKKVWGNDGTEFVVAAIPLGGYVKMLDETEMDVKPEEQHRAFNRQAVWKRICIVLAGPLFNFLFAIFAYSMLYTIGVEGMIPKVGQVAKQSLAEQIGLETGDQFMQVGQRQTPTWEGVIMGILFEIGQDQPITIQVQKSTGELKSYPLIMPEDKDITKKGELLKNLGITPWKPSFPAILGKIREHSPAEKAGLKMYDKVVMVNQQVINDWQAWVKIIQQHPEKPLQVTVIRDEAELHLEVIPEKIERQGKTIGQIGAYVHIPDDLWQQNRALLQYSPIESFAVALDKTWEMSALMLKMLKMMVFGQVSLDNLSGPISVAQFAGKSASIGWKSFLMFLAVVSISLGVLNLLPIPVLDGGHLLYYTVEIIRGKALSMEAQWFGQQVGLFLLFFLMTIALFKDIERILG